MSQPSAPESKGTKPRRGVRWGRIGAALLLLGALGGGLYLASWINARRYFLIVRAHEVRVARGRMLPVGHRAFVPAEPELRRAYESFVLPAGLVAPHGETMFDERADLDRALYRLLRDAIAFSLSSESRRAPEQVARYLAQLRAVPGASAGDQLELAELERDAAYLEARFALEDGTKLLESSARLFRQSARGRGASRQDGEWRARAIEGIVATLRAPAFGVPPLVPGDRVSPLSSSGTSTAVDTSTSGAPR